MSSETVSVMVINNDGGGHVDTKDFPAGTTVGEAVARITGGGRPASDYLVRLNRQPVRSDMSDVLQNEDRLTITPTKIEGAAARWPTEVPILTADDIHRGWLANADGTKRCLVGWSMVVFPPEHAGKVRRAICSVTGVGEGYLVAYNDARRNSKAKIARTWNKAMANLGYTEGNPEA